MVIVKHFIQILEKYSKFWYTKIDMAWLSQMV